MLRNMEYTQIVHLHAGCRWEPESANDWGHLDVSGYTLDTCINNLYSLRNLVNEAIERAEQDAVAFRREGVT